MSEFQWIDPGDLRDGELTLVLVEKTPADSVRGFCPAYQFEMRRVGEAAKVGRISLRIGDGLRLKMYAGHIGYTVEEEFRGHRYAARACRLILPLARRHGMSEVWITCNPENTASRRTCELVGAVFVEIVDVPEDMELYRIGERRKCRYRFDFRQ